MTDYWQYVALVVLAVSLMAVVMNVDGGEHPCVKIGNAMPIAGDCR